MIDIKVYNYVYKITNNINGKIYIGRHCTNDLNDGYMGSGLELQRDMKEFGKTNFSKEILHTFDTWEEMVRKETEYLTEDFVNSDDTYNVSRQGMGLITHTEEVRQKLRDINKGLVSVKDADGNNYRVSINDHRYLSGELKHNSVGMATVKDSEGNNFKVPIDDPRYLSGELVPINLGRKQSKAQIDNRVAKSKEWWKTNSHSDEGIQKMREVNVGKVTVRDVDGNLFRVSVDDDRIKTGELVYMWKGKKASQQQRDKISESKKGCVWVHNLELNKMKLIKPDIANELLNSGWSRGMIRYDSNKQ